MHVTIAICTWNRATLLDSTLASLAGLVIPPGVTWEVLVANNNSTDATEHVLDKYAERLPLERLFVAQQGKSHALNAVVARLRGELVLWTDDDVLVDRNWLASYVDAARRWPEASFFGGHVIPRFLCDEPSWLRPNWSLLSGVYAAREFGDASFALDRKTLPFGANMAARVALQKQYRYDPELGRRGDLLLSGEETALMQRWLEDGYAGRWVPASRIEHVITPDRLEPDHIRRFFFSLAESKRPRGAAAWRFVRLLRGAWYVARALKHQLKGRLCAPTPESHAWIACQSRVSQCWGRVETQWHDMPTWLKPTPLRRLKQQRHQPRLVTRGPVSTAIEAPGDDLVLPFRQRPRADAIRSRAA